MAQHASLEVLFGSTPVQVNLEQDSVQSLANDIQTLLARAAGHDANEATKASKASKAKDAAANPTQGPQVFQGVTGVFVTPTQVAEYRQNGHVSVGSAEVVPQGFTGVTGQTGGLTCTPVNAQEFTAWIDKNFPQQATNAETTQAAPQDTQAAHSAPDTTAAAAQNHAPQSAEQTGTLNAEQFTAKARELTGQLVNKYDQNQAFAIAGQVLGQFGHQGFSTVTPDQYAAILDALAKA